MRSVRVTDNNNSAINPSDKATVCTMVAAGLRCIAAKAKRQAAPMPAPSLMPVRKKLSARKAPHEFGELAGELLRA